MGAPALADAPRFAALADRLANHDELDAIIIDWTRGLDRYDVAGRLQAAGVPAAAVADCGADAYDDPHLQARDYFQQVTHPEAGTFLLSGPMWKLSEQGEPRHEPTPGLGRAQRPVAARPARRVRCRLRRTGARFGHRRHAA